MSREYKSMTNPKITIDTLKRAIKSDGNVHVIEGELMEQIAEKYAPDEVDEINKLIYGGEYWKKKREEFSRK